MLTVGQVARQAGIGVQAIRFYEREGILSRAARTPSGYRQFPEEAARIVRFVKRAQELGFSLEEIKPLLRLRSAKPARCEQVQKIAQSQKQRIEKKIKQLERMKDALDALLLSCGKRGSSLDCPILESFEEKP